MAAAKGTDRRGERSWFAAGEPPGLKWRPALFCLAAIAAILLWGPLARAARAADKGAQADPQPSAPVPQQSAKVRLFNIPAQPLSDALQAYSLISGYQIIYDSRALANRRSSPIIGLFSPETALRMLLDGTDLTIRYTGPRDITLVSSDRLRRASRQGTPELTAPAEELTLDTLYVDVAPGVADRPDFTDYGRFVRLEVRQALARSPETAKRIYNIQLDVKIDPNGTLRRRLVRSSGSPALDLAIGRVITSIRLNKLPPKGLPQPIRITIIAI